MLKADSDFSTVRGDSLIQDLAIIHARIDSSSDEYKKIIEFCEQGYQIDFIQAHGGNNLKNIWSFWNDHKMISTANKFVDEFLRNTHDDGNNRLLLFSSCNVYGKKLSQKNPSLPIFYPITGVGGFDYQGIEMDMILS